MVVARVVSARVRKWGKDRAVAAAAAAAEVAAAAAALGTVEAGWWAR